MAGYQTVVEESSPNRSGYEWVKPRELVRSRQDFCVLSVEQDSFNQQGHPQYTFSINYVRDGVFYEKAFNLECTFKGDAPGWREVRVAAMSKRLPMHHLRLVERENKRNPQYPFLDFEDVPGMDDEPCACMGAGIIDPDDPSTWTTHYRLSQAINLHLVAGGLGKMDTSEMTVEALRTMCTVLGIEA